MGVLKSLARKMGVGAARFAKRRVTGALDAASDALERAVFGEGTRTEEDGRDAERGEGGERAERGEAERGETDSPDPFAKLKEKERKENGKVR